MLSATLIFSFRVTANTFVWEPESPVQNLVWDWVPLEEATPKLPDKKDKHRKVGENFTFNEPIK